MGIKDGSNSYKLKFMGIFNKIFGSEETEKKVNELKTICRRYEMCQNSLKRLAGELYYKQQKLWQILRSMDALPSANSKLTSRQLSAALFAFT